VDEVDGAAEVAMTKITPFLWFDNQAEEAAKFYTSIFNNSKIRGITLYGEDGSGPKGSVMTVGFSLDGQEFTALNGGPKFPFSPAISFVVHCTSQKEVDEYWDRLGAGGATQACGWLTDRYGVSWQIVPTILIELLQDKDSVRARRVIQAMMAMKKIDIEALKRAHEGR
jgi:predicted 3-demethylubiquinone-9 3-methyltransferase (glyoxalase superfamily)